MCSRIEENIGEWIDVIKLKGNRTKISKKVKKRKLKCVMRS